MTRTSALSGLVALALLAGCEKETILPGERFPVRAPLEDSIPTQNDPSPKAPAEEPANRSVPISLPVQAANADWAQRGGNARHLAPHGSLGAAPQRIWTATIGGGNSRKNRISAAPIVLGSRIFTIDAHSTVTATSTGGGHLWSADLTPDFDKGSDVSGGGLAAGGGKLFATTGYGELVALDGASGGVIWRQRLDSPATAAPAVDGGIVYVVGRDGAAWAVDAANGKVLWTLPGAPAGAGMLGSAAPAVTDTAVIFPFASGDVVAALKKGGTQLWSSPVAGRRLGRAYAAILNDITGDPVVSGGTIFMGTAAGRTVAVSAASGEKLWTADDGALNPPLPVGGSVFVVNDQAQLVRLDAATGERIWAVDMPYFQAEKVKKRKAIYAHFGPVLAGGRLVVASSDGWLRFFSPVNGALVGTAEIPGGAATPVALAGGMLFVVSEGGQLHAFR
ncbi:MAG: PQQ-binding-like beta-propeller repeat protein [Paracoccaceae bacterium]